MARAYLSQEAAGALDSEMARLALRELQEKLGAVRGGIEAVQRLIQDVGVSGARPDGGGLPTPLADRVSSQGRH
jgi:hypothetical protein